MQLISDPLEMQALALAKRRQGVRIGVVPTMGFLHEGHLSLVRLARQHSDWVVLTLFVNPTQFGPHEDLDRYPRSLERDCTLCQAEGVDAVFAPESPSVYTPDHSVRVEEEQLSRGLCGASRPGHFSGVLTVVAKLFNLTQPDVAVFGEKDAQQLRVIRRMVRDLNMPVRILSGPIFREADGLAMSSRNQNLDEASRRKAPRIYQALCAARDAAAAGERNPAVLRQKVLDTLGDLAPGTVDYLELVDDETLVPPSNLLTGPALMALAVQFPGVRLIDNILIHAD